MDRVSEARHMSTLPSSKAIRSAVLVAAAVAAMCGMGVDAGAAADPTNDIATCHSKVVSGVDTDTCVGNPDADGSSGPGYNVIVRPQIFFGIGAGI
jgi:hypothetical protein